MIISRSTALRRVALFLTMLMSGGWLLFPRLPMLAAVVVLHFLLCGRRLVLDRRLMPILLLLVAIMMLTLLRSAGSDVLSTAIRFANFFAGILVLDLYLRTGAETFRSDLFAITRLMAWQALFTVVLGELAEPLFLTLEVNETTYHTFLLVANYHTMIEDAGPLVRPDGFFYEPGVFQIYLNLFLYLALYVYRSPGQSLLAVLAVFSTQSTTGLVIAMMLVGVFVARHFINRGSLHMRLAKFVAATILVIPMVFVVGSNVVDKFTGESRGSFWARQYDLLTGVNVIIENPVLGIGFEYEDYYAAAGRLGYVDTELNDETIIDRGNTNGVVFLVYSIGIPLALPFLIGMFRQRMFEHRALVGTLLFLSFLSESMIFTPFFLVLIYSGMFLRRRTPAPAAPPVLTTAHV